MPCVAAGCSEMKSFAAWGGTLIPSLPIDPTEHCSDKVTV